MDKAKVDIAEGGKPENPKKNPTKHGRDQLYTTTTHISPKFFWESTRGYTQLPKWSPIQL